MRSQRRAFSLIELMLVLAIISIIAGLLLPAILAARETSRRSVCQNNLRQVGMGLCVHLDSYDTFPYGGWGHLWTGVPGRGSGLRQPGSWAYSLMPYLELNGLHNAGLGLTGIEAIDAFSVRISTPVALFSCPTRRATKAWPVTSSTPHATSPRPWGAVTHVARGDYAINGGCSHISSFGGPANLEEGDSTSFWQSAPSAMGFTGVSHLRVAAKSSSFEDGMSKTYLVGEKMLAPDAYETGQSLGDNESLYTGFSNDLHRYAGIVSNATPWMPPMQDGEESIEPRGYLRFGSAHAGGLNLAFCDGAVQFVSFNVEGEVHFRYGHRRDGGNPIETLK